MNTLRKTLETLSRQGFLLPAGAGTAPIRLVAAHSLGLQRRQTSEHGIGAFFLRPCFLRHQWHLLTSCIHLHHGRVQVWWEEGCARCPERRLRKVLDQPEAGR